VDSQELRRLLLEPESETLEFRAGLPSADEIAKIVAAFANTAGGTLVVGFDERHPERSGLSHPGVAAGHIREWIQTHVVPVPQFRIEALTLESGRTLVVVQVQRSGQVHFAEGRALRRLGPRTALMERSDLVAAVAARSSQDIAVAMAELSDRLAELKRQLGWRRQLPLQIAFLLFGVVLGYLLALWNPLG
jgi:predicted HTH transcriptional regulator